MEIFTREYSFKFQTHKILPITSLDINHKKAYPYISHTPLSELTKQTWWGQVTLIKALLLTIKLNITNIEERGTCSTASH